MTVGNRKPNLTEAVINMNIKRVLGTLAAGMALALSACGGGGAADGNSSGEPVVVAVQPYAQLVPAHLAVDRGFFKENGLNVELLNATGGGSSVVAGVMAGDIDLAYTSWASFLQAANKGLPLRAVRANDGGTAGQGGLFAMPKSGTKDLAQLAGKPIGVNLGGTQEITTRAVMKAAGVTGTDLKLVNTSQSNMVAALTSNKIAAGWLAEPFITIAERAGAVEVSSAFVGPTGDIPVGVWVARQDFIQENPEQVTAFVESLNKATEIAINDRAARDASILSYTEIAADVVPKMRDIDYIAEPFDYEGLDRLQKVMVDLGLLEAAIPDSSLLAAR